MISFTLIVVMCFSQNLAEAIGCRDKQYFCLKDGRLIRDKKNKPVMLQVNQRRKKLVCRACTEDCPKTVDTALTACKKRGGKEVKEKNTLNKLIIKEYDEIFHGSPAKVFSFAKLFVMKVHVFPQHSVKNAKQCVEKNYLSIVKFHLLKPYIMLWKTLLLLPHLY